MRLTPGIEQKWSLTNGPNKFECSKMLDWKGLPQNTLDYWTNSYEKIKGCKYAIRKDCFQVKSKFITLDNFVVHYYLHFIIKSKCNIKAGASLIS
jgi:hypothetical protein